MVFLGRPWVTCTPALVEVLVPIAVSWAHAMVFGSIEHGSPESVLQVACSKNHIAYRKGEIEVPVLHQARMMVDDVHSPDRINQGQVIEELTVLHVR